MANVDIATLTAKLVLNTKEFSEGIDSATKDIGKITSGNAWSEAGKSLNTLGKAATVAGGAIMTGSGIAVKAAVDFEDAFAGVKKTVNVTGTQNEIDTFFAHLEDGIREMATRLPVTATEIAGVTEAAGQLGIQNDNLLGFTETMIGLGSATNITAQDAAVSLAQFANVTKMSQTDFDKLGSSIVELGNNMATDEASIVNMATEMAVLAQTCGFSEADILGISGAMSSMGLDAAASGTAMQRFTQDIVQAVNNGGPFLEVFADTAGMSAEEFAKAWGEDATGAFMAFIDGLGSKSTAEQLQIFETLDIKQMREIDMLQRLAGNTELVNSAIGMSNDAWKENSALSEEVAKRNETTASQFQMVKNMLTDIAVEAGEALLPVVRELLEQARPLLEQVSTYLKEHPDTVKRIADVGVKLLAIGTAVSGIVKVVTAIGSFITTIKTLGTAISVIAGGGAAAGGAVAGGGIIATLIGALSGILPVLAAVAAAVGVFALAWHNDWFGIQEKFGAAKEWIVGKFGELKTAFEEGGLQGVIEKIGDDISGWWTDKVVPWFDGIKDSISELLDGLKEAIADKMQSIKDTVSAAVENIKNALKSVGDAISDAWDKVKNFASNAWDKVTDFFGGGRAEGGYVKAGTTYLAGELGPELITPTRSGYVHTAEETAGMLGAGQTITINIQGDVYDDERSMRSKLKNAMLSVLEEQMAYG